MKKILTISFLLTIMILADGRQLYIDECSNCHGLNADKSIKDGFNPLVSRGDGIKNDLMAYKKGELDRYNMGILMQSLVAEISDNDLSSISKYISTLK